MKKSYTDSDSLIISQVNSDENVPIFSLTSELPDTDISPSRPSTSSATTIRHVNTNHLSPESESSRTDYTGLQPTPHFQPTTQNKQEPNFREQMMRLAKFGANLADAFSCFIFIPESSALRLINPQNAPSSKDSAVKHSYSQHEASNSRLLCLGFHSLSQDLIPDPQLPSEAGLIGWVASHKKAIHVSPFEHDSRTLGVYLKDQGLKSFLGIPIQIPESASSARVCGVLACDSKKSYAFSKLQGKLFEELADQISAVIKLSSPAAEVLPDTASAWPDFQKKVSDLVSSLGTSSIEVMRIKVKGWASVEQTLGSERCFSAHELFHRLLLNSLPPHIPYFRTPSGEAILVLDNMTSAFYESRARALCEHVSGTLSLKSGSLKSASSLRENSTREKGINLAVSIKRSQQLVGKYRNSSIWEIIRETGNLSDITTTERGFFGTRNELTRRLSKFGS